MLTLKLPQFEGPIELLHALVQKQEIDIYALELKQIVDQICSYLGISPSTLDKGAESISHAGHLLWMKSRALLPQDEQAVLVEEEGNDFQLSFFEKLVEYCRFKEAARHLSAREEKAAECYLRQGIAGIAKKPLGIEHLSLNDLATLFKDALEKAKDNIGLIQEEEWRVADKIISIRKQLKDYRKIPFELLFASDYSKLELIVLFLAVLELMKLGEICVMREQVSQQVVILPYGERN